MTHLGKILVAYFPRPPIIAYLKEAFERKGIEAHGFYSDVNNWFDRYFIHYVNKTAHNLRILPKSRILFTEHPLSHLHYRSRVLLSKVREVSPDAVLIIRGRRFSDTVLKEIGKTSVLMGWWIEGEERMEEAFREFDLFDHYFFMSSVCIEEGQRRGFRNISLLHHSVSTKAFHPVESEKKYDWCFVGGWSPGRMAYIERAFQVSRNGVIYGPKWLKKNFFNMMLHDIVKGRYIAGEDLARLYNESRVVLNITRWGTGGGKQRGGLTMRVVEVPACKACLLTDDSRDLEKVVTPGEHVAVYEGVDDFEKKLDHYIRSEADREQIAMGGFKHVVANHTYDAMVDEISSAYHGVLSSKVGREAPQQNAGK